MKKRPNVTYAEKLFIFVLKKLSKCIKCFIILKKCFGIVSASQLHITLKLKNPYYMYLLFISSFIWLGRLKKHPSLPKWVYSFLPLAFPPSSYSTICIFINHHAHWSGHSGNLVVITELCKAQSPLSWLWSYVVDFSLV